jgi:molybdate transport system regulatory protein
MELKDVAMPRPTSESASARISLRVDLGPSTRLGPGKVDLLEAIEASGSISGAGRAMKMSYRRAWLLVDELNRMFREPLVAAAPGGSNGGGAHLTPMGREIVAHYRAIESEAMKAAALHIRALQDAAAKPAATP